MLKTRIAASFFASAALAGASLIIAPPAAAETHYLSASCERSERFDDETTCDGGYATFSIDAEATHYWVSIKAPAEHCSVVQYHLFQRDASGGFYRIGGTRFLRAGEFEEVTIPDALPRGENVFQLGVTGKVGGCNEGVMSSWGAYVTPMVVPQ
jgi:hypothetical protein